MTPASSAAVAYRAAPNRGVYVDYLGRFAWTVDSQGRRSKDYTIFAAENPDDVASALQRQLDELDPIPSSAFVPAPLSRPPHLRLM